MIQLHSHCLVFETAAGEHIPCAVEDVSVEVIGEAVEQLDHEIVKQAAAAVLHYFKVERKQTVVTIAEFTAALEGVLSVGVTANNYLAADRFEVALAAHRVVDAAYRSAAAGGAPVDPRPEPSGS